VGSISNWVTFPTANTQSHFATEGSFKTGQALAMQAAVLPPAYGEAFSTLFDEAPQMSYEEVEKVFKRDFDKLPDEMFDVFEREAKASASIASVFKARLKSGEWVAVKVQKPEIEKQVQVPQHHSALGVG
jgi:aarF domain-containing kinase